MRQFLVSCMAFMACMLVIPAALAQWDDDYYNNYRYNNNNVGGVSINASGMISLATVADDVKLQQEFRKNLSEAKNGFQDGNSARRVSLKRLDAIIRQCVAAGKAVPGEVEFLGGLTSVDYVYLYPETGDVVLVGPAEPWTAGPHGVVVGKTTGRPVLLLDDLVSVLRASLGSQRGEISVSIDPTPEGLKEMRAYTSGLKNGNNSKHISAQMEKKLGPQSVTISGIRADSHFAGVMAAADYRMKQISMGQTKSPVAGLTSFVSMLKKPVPGSNLPRWWLAPNYEKLERNADGTAWCLKNGKVRTMSETDFFDGQKMVRGGGTADPVFEKWAQNMTAKYEKLSEVEPVFGQLRNCMDLALVAAILVQQDITGSLPGFTREYKTVEMIVPKQTPSTAVVAQRSGFVMFVTGGVAINPWQIVENNRVNAALSELRETSQVIGKTWWSN